MKKSLTILFLLLLATPLILAEENITDKAQEGLSALKGGLDLKTENILEREIQIPSSLQIPARILFGIKDTTTITIERLVVLLAIWIVLFTLIQGALTLTPFFKGEWLRPLASGVITILVAMTGSINSMTIFFFNLGDTFEWMSKLGPFQIFIGLAIAALIFFIGRKVTDIIEKKMLLSKAESSGESIGRLIATAKTSEESARELTK